MPVSVLAVALSMVGSVGIASNAQVAFAARFYFSDDRRSSYQIYVCRLDGSHRRQISTNKDTGWAVRWLDSNRLVWGNSDKQLTIYDLRLGRVVQRIQLKEECYFEGASSRREFRPWADERVMLANGRIVRRPRIRDTEVYGDQWRFRLPNGSTMLAISDSEQPEPYAFYYNLDGKRHEVGLQGSPSDLWIDGKGGAYLRAYDGGGSGGDQEFVYSFDPKGARVRLIVGKFDDIDFDPGSKYWSGREPFRPLVGLGGVNVWANKLYVGNLKSGKHWTIADGVVHGTSVQIRPGL